MERLLLGELKDLIDSYVILYELYAKNAAVSC